MSEDKRLIKEERLKLLKESFQHSSFIPFSDYAQPISQYRVKSGLNSVQIFYDCLAKSSELLTGQKDRRPIIGYFCNMVPEEIVLAMDGIPLRLCSADSACAQHGEEIVPGDICPVIKSIGGSAYNRAYDKIDLLVIPATCDGKIKLAEILSPIHQIYFLDLPKQSDYLKNVDIWEKKYDEFFQFLQKKFNRKISRKELLAACDRTNRRTKAFRQIYHFRAGNPGIINGFDYFVMAYASFFMEPGSWAENAQKVYAEALAIKKEKGIVSSNGRILLSGAPVIFPNFKLIEILEEAGADISADTMCSAFGRLYDPVKIDEETHRGILRALSLKYVAASMCPCFLGIDKLVDYLIDTVRQYSLDGVIYYNLRLCQVFELQTGLIRAILKEKKIPFLSLKTDLAKEDIGQLKTRVEAFLEMLR